jgi:hypothetical protein
VLIDHTHKKWLVASVVILGVATAIYVPYAAFSPAGPSGRSPLGLIYGVVGFAFMIFAGLLGARKKVPVWRVGRAQTWMRGHLWLGLLSLPIILFHGGFRFGGGVTTILMILLIVVVASGVFGAILQHYLPRVMTAEVPYETIFEQIDRVRAQLRAEADEIVSGAGSPPEPVMSGAPGLATAAIVEVEITDEEMAPLRKFYAREVQPFLESAKPASSPLADSAEAHRLFQELSTLLPSVLHGAVDDLETICEEDRQLRRQIRLHHWLHGWLMLHIPLSLALLLLGAVHAVMALRY